MIGRTISHYEFLEHLGEGGMGVVYRARDTRLDRTVAIKFVRPDAASNRERRERFVREAKAASALNHPHIVTIHDIDRDGTTLDDLLLKEPLPIDQALRYAVQIGSALAAAHAAGIVHRDVKPANVTITKKGEVKLADFGLAKLGEPRSGDEASPTLSAGFRTEHGAVLGTPSYMSPERRRGGRSTAAVKEKIAYFGFSWGTRVGLINTALEKRFKASALLAGGLDAEDDAGMPEIDEMNFEPRVTTPTLMSNGRDDFRFPLVLSQIPMFRLLGPNASDKSHVLFEGGHIPPRLALVKPTLDWLDRYLGPVTPGR